MKRTSSFIVAIIVIVFTISSCGLKKITYDYHTELGDSLSIQVSQRGNLHGWWLEYIIRADEATGLALISGEEKEQMPNLPEYPFDHIEIIGSYGNTSFYKVFNSIVFYQHDIEYIDDFGIDLSIEQYRNIVENLHSDKEPLLLALSDLIKSHNFDYIYRYGEILAYEKDDAIKSLLERYATSEFTEEERDVNKNSSLTEYDMTEWAKGLLETYYVE